MRSFNMMLFFAFCSFFSGCATFYSEYINDPKDSEGLVYYLPKKDIVITMEVDANGVATKVAIDQTSSYPDMRYPFLLTHGLAALTKNETDIGIKNGLLTSSKATMTPQITDFAKGLAGAFGTGVGFSKQGVATKMEKCSQGTHSHLYEAKYVDDTMCGVSIKIENIGPKDKIAAVVHEKGRKEAGVYHRMNFPYRITAVRDNPALVESKVVFSPSESPNFFLPIAKGFFASTNADLGFEDGVLISYKQTTESELVAAVKLPADIAAAYFAAIGAVFSAFSTNNTAETNKIQGELKLELAKQKYAACIDAIERKDDAALSALKCASE
jgi:hypothetical protein